MITWISKGPLAALASIVLSACVDGSGPPDSGTTQSRMMSGAILLVAPTGYCIDNSSLSPAFAMMARCDVLGQGAPNPGVPLGVITASFGAVGPDQPLPTAAQIEATKSVRRVLQAARGKDQLLLRVEGPAPIPSLSETHWRGAARVGDHLAAVAVYGPKNGVATGPDGERILTRLIERTRAGTRALFALSAKTTSAKKTGTGPFGGLFD